MRFADTLNRLSGKWMPLVVIACLFIGITFSEPIGKLTFLVPYVFAFMTFTGALNSSFRQMFDIVRHPLPLISSYAVIHAVIPLAALVSSSVILHGHPNLISGTVLEYVVPSAVSSIMWCSVSCGNMSLSLSIILLDTLTAPLIVPFSLRLFIGSHAQINVVSMMFDLTWMVTIPAVLTMLLNQLSDNRIGKKLSPVMAPYGKLALIFIITVNSTRVAPFVRHITSLQLLVIAVILVLAIFGYMSGWLAGLITKAKRDEVSSMTFGCGMRNISAGAVIAAAYFPAEVMFPVMVGTLFQQALAALFSFFLSKRRNV